MTRTLLTRTTLALSACMISATFANADLSVRFIEGAPKDTFKFENTGSCSISNAEILLNLSTSTAGLVFDVTSQGAGVEVFQPFEIVEGTAALNKIPMVSDGQSKILLNVATLAAGDSISFTIDVDDTKGQREITVSGSEIAGATVDFTNATQSASAAFSPSATADLAVVGC